MQKEGNHFRFLIDHENDLNELSPVCSKISYYQRILINNAQLDIEMGEFAVFERRIHTLNEFYLIENTNRYILDESMVGDLFLYAKNHIKKTVVSVTLEDALSLTHDFFGHQSLINEPYFPRLFYTFKRKNMHFQREEIQNELFYLDFDLRFFLPLFTLSKNKQKNPQVFLKDAYGRNLLELAQCHEVSSLPIAQEKQIRVKQASTHLLDRSVFESIQYLPVISKAWMGEYHLKRLLRMPNVNRLPHYEYESKLSIDHLYIQQKDLPYPILERYQTESIRWYINDQRIGFRGDRASLVTKGKADRIDHIAKRVEEKTQQLSTWDFYAQLNGDDPDQHFSQKTMEDLNVPLPIHLEMRRMKRQLCLLSPLNNFYSVCLDDCTADQWEIAPLKQIEIEYNGKFLFTEYIFKKKWWDFDFIVGLLDQILNQIKPVDHLEYLSFEHLQSLSTLYTEINDQIRGLLKQLHLLFLITDRQISQEMRDRIQAKNIIIQAFQVFFENQKKMQLEESNHLRFKKEEQEIIQEMNVIVEALKQRCHCKSSKKTKKKWLKEGVERYLSIQSAGESQDA